MRRTQEQAEADQLDCDLGRMVRRCLNQGQHAPEARQHWEKVAQQIEGARVGVRQRMHELDREATE